MGKLPNKQLVTIVYMCGHERERYELMHEGHDIQDKLDWFKENALCLECKRLSIRKRVGGIKKVRDIT